MAGENWFCFTVDKDGKDISSRRASYGGVVELYKNWLYFGEREGTSFYGEIKSGEMTYFDIIINAISDEELNSIFCVLRDKDNPEKVMFGIGGYAWDGDEWVGVTEKHFEFFRNWFATLKLDLTLPNIISVPSGQHKEHTIIQPQPTYREQPGCHNCHHRFVVFEHNETPQYYCAKDAPPRPKCGSMAMKEEWETFRDYVDEEDIERGPDDFDLIWEAQCDAWNAWRKPKAVESWGICDGWEGAK